MMDNTTAEQNNSKGEAASMSESQLMDEVWEYFRWEEEQNNRARQNSNT